MDGAVPAIPGFQAVRTRGQAALVMTWIDEAAKSGTTMNPPWLPGPSCGSGESFGVPSDYGELLTTMLRNATIIAAFCADVNRFLT
jgi:hypothetical protein